MSDQTNHDAVQVDVMNYKGGERLARTAVTSAEWAAYAACKDARFQWPQGIAKAGDVFDAFALIEMDIDRETVIFLD